MGSQVQSFSVASNTRSVDLNQPFKLPFETVTQTAPTALAEPNDAACLYEPNGVFLITQDWLAEGSERSGVPRCTGPLRWKSKKPGTCQEPGTAISMPPSRIKPLPHAARSCISPTPSRAVNSRPAFYTSATRATQCVFQSPKTCSRIVSLWGYKIGSDYGGALPV